MHNSGKSRWAVLLALALLLVAACAAPARFQRPADFPFHVTDHPFFDVHWGLERSDGKIHAVGLVEAARVDGVRSAIVELRELDPSGRVVNRALGHTYGGRLNRGDTRPFYVALRPKTQSDRFEVEVWSFNWDAGFGEGK